MQKEHTWGCDSHEGGECNCLDTGGRIPKVGYEEDTYKGKRIGEMSIEELREAVKNLSGLYSALLNDRMEE